jgi:hypothetical protein
MQSTINIEEIKTIEIARIGHGWLTFFINNHPARVSYIVNFKLLMKDLRDIGGDIRRINLDGEGVDLYLTSWLVYNVDTGIDDIYILWENWESDVPEFIMFKCDYSKYKEIYNDEFARIEKKYDENFAFDESKFGNT